MRLPVQFNETDVQVPALRGQWASMGEGSAAAGALATGAEQAGANLQRGISQLAAVEQEKAKFAAGTEAMELFTNAAQRTEDLHLSLKTANDADPTTHVARFEQGFKDIVADESVKTDNPLVKQAFGKLSQRYYLEASLQARKDANGMFLDREKASVASSLENLARQTSEATTPEGKQFLQGVAQGYLASKQGVLTAQEIQRLGSNFQERTVMDDVRSQVRADPFADVDKTVNRLSPENQERMTAFQESRQRQWIATNDAYQKSLERQNEKQRQEILTDFEARALKGGLSVEELDRARSARWIEKPDEYKRLYDLITAGPKEQASEPATLTRVIIGTHGDVPTMSDRTLNDLHDAGLLNTPDWKAGLDRRRQRQDYIEGKFNADDTRLKADQERDLGKARALGQAEFQIPAIYDKLEGNKGKVWSAYLEELFARTQKGENAMKVATEIIPRYKGVLGMEAQMDVTNLRKLLDPYEKPDDLDAALRDRTITQGEYEAKARLFRELKDALDNQTAAYGPQKPAAPAGGIGAKIRSFLPSAKPPENLGR